MFKNDFVETIRTLKQVKPREDWVVLTKKEILPNPTFKWRPVFAAGISLAILIGVFVLSQNSLPGEALYKVKKVSEKGQVLLVSKAKKPEFKLGLANKRLQELTEIAEKNGEQEPEQLASAVSEFQASAIEAAKNLTDVGATTSSDPVMMQRIVEETRKIEKNKAKVKALGVEVGATEELDNAIAQLVQREIEKLETQVLTDAQEQALPEIKRDYEAKDYYQALEKILLLSYPQDK